MYGEGSQPEISKLMKMVLIRECKKGIKQWCEELPWVFLCWKKK